MSEIDAKQLRLDCIKSYAKFCSVMQGPGWFDPIHEKLCNWVQYQIMTELTHQTKSGEEDKIIKLNVVLSRGALKSTIITKYLPVWLNLQPKLPDGSEGCNFRTLIASNTSTNARKKLNDIRGLFDSSPEFKALFPEMKPHSKRWTNDIAEIKRTKSFPDATYEAAGTGTVKTGSHYNLILEDDTTAPKESDMTEGCTAPSREDLEKGIGWHKNATPLLVPKGPRIRFIVTTRWADDDLVDYVRKHEDYKFFDVPALDENGKRMFSMFYSESTLNDLKIQVGPYMFSCLYLNKPLDESQRTFKKEWLKTIHHNQMELTDPITGEPYPSFRTLAIDPAISEKDASCETAITEVLHVQKGKYSYQYWLRDVHGHFNPSEQVNKMLDMAEENIDEVKCLIVETTAYQDALRYALRDEMRVRNIHIDIMQFRARTNKEIRIQGMVPYFANGQVYLLSTLTPEVESQLTQFPHGKLVDIIDCFSMHLKLQKAQGKIHARKPKAEILNPNSATEVLKQIKAVHQKRTGYKVQSSEDFFHGLSTGLGINHDLQRTLQGVTNE